MRKNNTKQLEDWISIAATIQKIYQDLAKDKINHQEEKYQSDLEMLKMCIDLENKIIRINKTVYSKIKDDKGRWFLGTTKTNSSCREVFICDTLYKILSNYKEKQKLLKKKYGRKYKKYELEPIKNEYGKINEYKVIESKHKNLNSVEMVFTKNNGLYV